MKTLREATIGPLLCKDPLAKAAATLALDPTWPVAADAVLHCPDDIPGRPARPELVAHTAVAQLPLSTVQGRAALIHALTHIELNAIDLALDIVWRFPGMPDAFYRDWLQVAQEEAQHFTLLREHLLTLGHDYGDFQAHNSLWQMAERTQGDLLARLALVPRTLEARGLDASPAVRNKLVGIGDQRGAAILDIILRDEIGHVAVGNRWYAYLCAQSQLDPVQTYAELTQRYDAPRLRGPFNLSARRAAGFSEAELAALSRGAAK